ncbi:MAG: 3',5'-cyclic-AMP phosphodiesterase [Pseudanabaenaceae cyanobacterium SKYGB_i_bin29]|nr:3',5'-cyclic-AMP phosphodiesterase [Pseudanabaenaceae cyanobacterium SKYG29]MDW8421582.1 3',5'-cyclic-AMP phosphodiesterase [Pseudanabaenaceae cyanobacterium SKYGB_i_bin29]
MSLQIVQLTDIHLCDDPNQVLLGVNTDKSFDRVLSCIRQSLPHLLLLTGDLAQDGGKPSYRRLVQKVTQLNVPAYYLPGNHDDLEAMMETIPPENLAINRSVVAGGWHLVLLNSAVPGLVEGKLGSSTLLWLERALQQYPDLPTLIALHHPVLPVGSVWLDRIGLQDSEEFWRICGNYPQVKVVIAGHAHQEHEVWRFTAKGMVRSLVTPSTCAQFQPNSPEFATDNLPPGCRRLTLESNGKFTTIVERVK